MKQRVAIIGAGIGGLTAGYLLQDIADIRLFEKDNRIGGNAHTLRTKLGYDVDIAVCGFGKAPGYGNFFKLLDKLCIPTTMMWKTHFSLENLDTREGWYVTPMSLSGLFTQRFAMFLPSKMMNAFRLFMIMRKGVRLLNEGRIDGLTMGQTLDMIPYAKGEAKVAFMCYLCLMSSMLYTDILNGPAEFFFNKLRVHEWLTSILMPFYVRCATNKTRSYVDALATHYRDRIIVNARIKTVLRDDTGVTLVMEDGGRERFDKVIFAVNADQALALLADPTPEERRILGAWKYLEGTMVVHTDNRSFPPRALCQSYTFLYSDRGDRFHTSVNGSIWHQPNVPKDSPYIATQHPNFTIDPEKIEHTAVRRTPIFDFASFPTIGQLPSLNGNRHSYFCGSHFGVGLHEDAVVSAINAAKLLGATWD
jgi:predicted NAD/FAD-binding protein